MNTNWYAIALFAHILGVLGMFIGMGAQWIILLRLRQSRAQAQAREWSGLVGPVARVGGVSGAVLVVAGLYMMATAWGISTPWLDVALGGLALMLALSAGFSTRRLLAIQRALAALAVEPNVGSIPPALRRQIDAPPLWIATQIVLAIALGIVFLMTVKPDLFGSLLALAIAIALGAIVGGATSRNVPRQRAATLPTSEGAVL